MNELKIIIKISYYLYPIIAVFGLIFNSIAFVVFSRKRFKSTVFCIYFRVLIIFDCLSQFLPINQFLEMNLDIYIKVMSNFLCKFRYYYNYSIFPVSGWILAIVSIDRFLTISFPKKFPIRTKIWFQILVCVLIIAFNFVYYSPNLFFYLEARPRFNNKSNLTVLTYKCRNPGIPLNLMDLIQSTLVPFFIMILFTILTVISIFRIRSNTTNKIMNNKSIVSKDVRFAFITITINILFLMLNLPYGIYFNVNNYFDNSDFKELISSLCSILFFLNLLSTFFINILVNSIFRNEFNQMVIDLIKRIRMTKEKSDDNRLSCVMSNDTIRTNQTHD